MANARELAELIRACRPCVVLTGAGMSTESGLPDFRSASGIWAGVDPYEVASIDAFRRDPERVWRWYGPRIAAFHAVQPNRGHVALAALERAGLVDAVVTQNIDTLHHRAGSSDVIEVHGSIRRAVCLGCGASETLDALAATLEAAIAPRCARCGEILKPDVVLFGEVLPATAITRAERLAREAALLLVVGSSLQVWPVAGLPEETLGCGGRLAIVDHEPTPYDERADVVVRGAAGDTLAQVAGHLGLPGAAPTLRAGGSAS